MSNEEKEQQKTNDSCGAEECGFTIFLDERQIYSFMESGDYSSARELNHFKEVGSQFETRVGEGGGLSILALAVSENRLSRDFAVLQIGHVLAKRGKKVLIVDCDFLQPGLSGLVENIEGLGFLDFLLYGSSLQSVAHPIGIDSVTVTGPGSFPVYKTMPFAKQEFGKVNDFLVKKSDVVIYCSTLYTDDGQMNPMTEFVEGILLCCRIEEMEEGELKRNIDALKGLEAMTDVICFSSRGEAAGPVRETVQEKGEETQPPPEKELEPVYIEKMGEIEAGEELERGKINLPRFITIAAAVIIISFVVWWVVTTRSIKERESNSRMTELVQKQRDAREAVEKRPVAEAVVDTTAVQREQPAQETVETAEPERAPEQAAPSRSHYAVHVASFKDISRAGSEVEYLERQGYEVKVVEVDIKGVAWFRILVGDYETTDKAGKARLELLALKRITYANVVKLKSDSTDGEK